MHGTLVATFCGGRWRGVLLLGASGAGKSDLAMRCLEQGWRLVADDRVIVWAAGGQAFGRSPSTLDGLLELRGQGMAAVATLTMAPIKTVARLETSSARQPAPAFEAVADVPVPAFAVAPFEASAPARLRRIVEGLDHGL